jgi:uncharacterized protein
MADWRECVIAYIRVEAQPVDKFGHQPRLYALAVRLGQGMDFDDDILFAAAELASWNHVPYTIARSRELLTDWGFPTEKLEAVAQAIASHQPHDEPTSAEAILLRDADILEQLGAVGALRALVKVGRDTRYATFSSVLPVLQHAVEQLPAMVRTEAARSLAIERAGRLTRLLEDLEDEAGELLF